jgi:hypothetical protein
MGSAQVIALSDVRASMQWQRLRDQLHARFDESMQMLGLCRLLPRLNLQIPGRAAGYPNGSPTGPDECD